jgi:hypothetical protein
MPNRIRTMRAWAGGGLVTWSGRAAGVALRRSAPPARLCNLRARVGFGESAAEPSVGFSYDLRRGALADGWPPC